LKLYSQENDECLMCHGDKGTISDMLSSKSKKAGKTFVVNPKSFSKSIHAGVKCISCHADLEKSDFPHNKPAKAKCGSCHGTELNLYNECMHGKAFNRGDPLAPTCQTCHGSHEIVSNKDKQSPVYPLNVPKLCGKCHREGSPVQLQRNIPQTHILENYTESIHGDALINKGLVVSATCASCHSPHRILPHTDSRSTISRNNIAATCTKCHAGIEYVHKKIIRGELWEKEAKVLPACVDCHQPHKIRNVFYDKNLTDVGCKKCHENQNIGNSQDGRSMLVTSSYMTGSVHLKISCTQCHTQINPGHTRPCDSISTSFSKVECSSCHSEVGNDYKQSYHGMLHSRNDQSAPSCSDCHGKHNILSKLNERSPIFPLNIPTLCSQCHQEGQKAAVRITGSEHEIINNYSESIHGKGLIKSGLTVTATCADCHTAHKGLPPDNPASSVNPDNISGTCGKCHFGIHEVFDNSVHSPLVTKTDKKLPTCEDCHSAHTIKRTDKDQFRTEILTSCGKCHEKIATTYFDTYHGKVSLLGSQKAAKCSDCHGSHDIMPIDNINSKLSRKNILTTCQKCHPNATTSFTRYLTHATHHDSKKYPILFISFWGMTLLLLGTFAISFLHTLLWLPRSIQMRKKSKALLKAEEASTAKRYTRFSRLNRILHFIMILSFLSLASTGLTLKFSYTPFAKIFADILGGVENAGIFHRIAAAVLFGIFITHIIDLIRRKRTEFGTWKAMLFGTDTMLPNKKDWLDVKASFKWFLGRGPRPQYGRWTYWEKFDYFAVFWGIFIIGSTGLTLWFPEFFSNFIPGWMLNVTTIIHSDEALLAAGFIFTVHFFNTHYRPEKFPMDQVIFTGQVSVEELKEERPFEYEQLVQSGELEKYLSEPFSKGMTKALKIFGFTALTIGMCLIIWIIYSFLVVY
jgi:cytochrome b subunit of formate dehydrogenase